MSQVFREASGPDGLLYKHRAEFLPPLLLLEVDYYYWDEFKLPCLVLLLCFKSNRH